MEKICPFCEEIFDQELIKDHIRIEHLGLETGAFQPPTDVSNNPKDVSRNMAFDCKDWDKKFTCESDQKNHQNIAHSSFKFACGKCDQRFLSEHSVNLHVKVMHSNHFEVKDLSKKNSKDLVKREVLVQSPNLDRLSWKKRKLFSANIMFKSVHEKIKDHQYEHCEMAFSSSRNLKRYKNIHSDIWDLVKCSYCDEAFVTKPVWKFTRKWLMKNWRIINVNIVKNHFLPSGVSKSTKWRIQTFKRG